MDRKTKAYLDLMAQELSMIGYILVNILRQNAKTEEEFQTISFIQEMLNQHVKQHNELLTMEADEI